MSLFLNEVRVIPLFTQSPGAPSSNPEDSAKVGANEPKGVSIHVDKHSGGDGFLAVPICAIVFTFIYLIIKAIMAPFTQRAKFARTMPQGGGGLTQEEVAVLHKLQRTLSQMESRVEALETILIEQARTEKNYGSKL